MDAVRCFMEHHVFAVWDFMSLLKVLQRRLSCVDLPWIPVADPAACRLVNEIVLGEESDEDGQGGYTSHFELYRRAMQQCGADLRPIDRLVDAIRSGTPLASILDRVGVPPTVRQFVETTFEIIQDESVCAVASAFTFGREDLLPDVFRRIVEKSSTTEGKNFDVFRYYLDRHIEVDGGEHGPMAWKLIDRLCGDDPALWQEAESAAIRSLKSRVVLWDGVCESLDRSRCAV